MVAKPPRKTPFSNLRPAAEYAIEWEAVDETPVPSPKAEFVGLTNEDRVALGLSPTPLPEPPATGSWEREDARNVLARALH